jgi:NAD(P)-dependent dehydrogenase (short-subunit alcohol dehydrogenase family)
VPELVSDALTRLRQSGSKVIYCQADISDSEDRRRMISLLRAEYGRLHVLVNNAGIAPPARDDILDATEASFEKVIRVNLQGPYFLTQAVANWMIEQRRNSSEFNASIINISSISANVASVNRGEYCISKAGVGMATQLWAVRLSEFDIPVYEVRPGVVRTDMTAGVQEKYDALIKEGLLLEPRWGTPEDVGTVVATLAAGGIPYATGQVVTVDGGMTVRRL